MKTLVRCLTYPTLKKLSFGHHSPEDIFPETKETGVFRVAASPRAVLAATFNDYFVGTYLKVHPTFIQVASRRGYLHIDRFEGPGYDGSIRDFLKYYGISSARRRKPMDEQERQLIIAGINQGLEPDNTLGVGIDRKAPYKAEAYADVLSLLTGNKVTPEEIREKFEEQHKRRFDEKLLEDQQDAWNESGRKAFVFPL
jgi:hypothetical protein